MPAQKPPAVVANIVHGNESYEVEFHWLPRAGEFLRLRRTGAAEPLFFQVEEVIHDVGEEGGTHAVEVHVSAATDPRLAGKKKGKRSY